MKSFRTLVVLKRPQQELWSIMRDHLVEFAGQVADIEEVRQVSRAADATGKVHIVNAWRARQQVPPALRAVLKVDEIRWIDRNTWDEAAATCFWSIEPGLPGDHVTCSGQTTFTETMAGRGTRLTFSGELDLKPGLLGGMEPMMAGLVESVVSTIIPRNLRSVAEAAAAYGLKPD